LQIPSTREVGAFITIPPLSLITTLQDPALIWFLLRAMLTQLIRMNSSILYKLLEVRKQVLKAGYNLQAINGLTMENNDGREFIQKKTLSYG
jgi:hypothetical protein